MNISANHASPHNRDTHRDKTGTAPHDSGTRAPLHFLQRNEVGSSHYLPPHRTRKKACLERSERSNCMKTSRPAVLTAAAILLGLVSLLSLTTPLVGGVPLLVVVFAVVAGLVGLVAVYGLWKAKRWGMIVAIILSVLNALSAAPGLFVQPNPIATTGAGVTIAFSVLIIVLTVLPSARQAYA